MITLTPDQARPHPYEEKPGWPLIRPHILQTGHGSIQADRWPDPRLMLYEVGQNIYVTGDPAALDLTALPPDSFVKGDTRIDPYLAAHLRAPAPWMRVLYELHAPPTYTPHPAVHPLTAADAPALAALNPDLHWIWTTWGSAATLAASGFAVGAFVDADLVAVAATFFLGQRYEEIGVVTEAPHQGHGLSTACAGALCEAIQGRGHVPTWSTTPDNTGSMRVAEKLDFTQTETGTLYRTASSHIQHM